MKILESINNHIIENNLSDNIRQLKEDRNFSVLSFMEIISGYLDKHGSKPVMEWIKEIYDYSVFKSFPHKQSSLLNPNLFEVYEGVLLKLQELNGYDHLDYDVKNCIDEYYKFEK